MENTAQAMKLLCAAFKSSLLLVFDTKTSEKLGMLCFYPQKKLFLLHQRSVNFICKELDNKHLRLCGP